MPIWRRGPATSLTMCAPPSMRAERLWLGARRSCGGRWGWPGRVALTAGAVFRRESRAATGLGAGPARRRLWPKDISTGEANRARPLAAASATTVGPNRESHDAPAPVGGGGGSSIDGFMSFSAPAGAEPDSDPTTEVPLAGRVLGLDLGSRRIGVAASDSAQVLAVGVETIERSSEPSRDRQVLAAVTAEYEAVGVVVGLPLSLDGGMGRAAIDALAEIDALRAALGVPVTAIDERLSTVAASSALRAGGRKARQRRAVVDRTAAAIILQSWLDRRRRAPSTGVSHEGGGSTGG